MINYVVAETGAFGFRNFIEDRAQHCADRFRIWTFESLTREQHFPPGTYVIATDQALPAERLVMSAVCEQLTRAGPGFRVFNDPAQCLDRVALLRLLHDAGRSRFRAVRASESFESLRYPVFVRDAVAHNGNLTPLLTGPREVRQALVRLALRGLSRRDLLVVEFCDTADGNGVFRKYSAFIVGDRVIPRCLDCGDNWMLKFNPRSYTPERVAAELDYLRTNPHEVQLREAFAMAMVQYGRMDYALIDGALQVWEINLNPCVGRAHPLAEDPPEVQASRELRREANDIFYGRFLAAWEVVDAETRGGEVVTVRVDQRLWNAALAERARWRRGERQRNLVRWAEQQRVLGALWRQVKPTVHRGIALWRH